MSNRAAIARYLVFVLNILKQKFYNIKYNRKGFDNQFVFDGWRE